MSTYSVLANEKGKKANFPPRAGCGRCDVSCLRAQSRFEPRAAFGLQSKSPLTEMRANEQEKMYVGKCSDFVFEIRIAIRMNIRYYANNRIEPVHDLDVYILCTCQRERQKGQNKIREQKGRSQSRAEKEEKGKNGGERCFQRKSVWVAADCEWCAAAPRLKPIRLPRARSPGMGEGGDW